MPPSEQDFYAALGVLRDSSPEEIKRAYFAAARRFHPDQNMLPGETELFLEVQRAYEVLSNPERRARYDATLPPQAAASVVPVEVRVQYSRESLVHLDEPQLVYALLESKPAEKTGVQALAPRNLCLVLDRSTSMQGEKFELAKAAAIRLIDMLRPEDLFGLVVFSDRAEVLLPSAYRHDLMKAQRQIQSLQSGGATEILQGLQAGMAELRRSRDPGRSNHLILLTDGHTYGDEQDCLDLADEAGRLNISITGFGLGGDWNDIFLDTLVGRTGGNSTYIAQPQDMQELLTRKFAAIASTLVDDLVLEARPGAGVELKSCHRLQPEGGPIEGAETMHLGPILQRETLQVLFEFVIGPEASKLDAVTLLEGDLRAVVAARPMPFPPIRLRMERPSAAAPTPGIPPASLVEALSRLSLYRLQEQARKETEAGEYEAATRHLRNLAVQLQAQGHHDLSRTTLLEAEGVERLQALSGPGSKQLKYATRALMKPAAGVSK